MQRTTQEKLALVNKVLEDFKTIAPWHPSSKTQVSLNLPWITTFWGPEDYLLQIKDALTKELKERE
jgi:hypothetical protein